MRMNVWVVCWQSDTAYCEVMQPSISSVIRTSGWEDCPDYQVIRTAEGDSIV